MEKFSEEITYTPVVSNHSSYVYRNVAPQGSNTVTLSATAVTGPTEFILPPSVMNLSKSRLEFNLLLPDPGATVNVNWLNANLNTIINRIVLYSSATNAVLCDVSNFNLFSSMVSASSTKLDDYLTKSLLAAAGALTNSLATSQLCTVEDIVKSNTATNTANKNGANTDMTQYNGFLGRRQFYIGQDTEASYLDISLPFDGFKHTILSLNKNIYAPENLVLQIYWNNTDNFAFSATSLTVPTTGTAALASATVTGINVLVAQENNLAVVSQVIDRVMKGPGLSLPFTYPSVVRNNFGSTTSPSWQTQLTKAYGQRILGVITAAFSKTARSGSNVHIRGEINNYNTFINSVALRYPAGISAIKSEDYILNKPYFTGSVIQAAGEYFDSEWFHFDSFVGEKPLYLVDHEQTEVDGMDVSAASSTWQFQGTLTNSTNYDWVNIILGQKILSITSAGTMVM